MLKLLSRLTAIVMLHQGPQDLPAGRSLLPTCLILYLLVTTVSLGAGQRPENLSLVLTLAALVPLALSWIVLKLVNRLARWEQTVSALFGTSALISLLSLPLSLMIEAQQTPMLALMLLATLFWSLAVNAHIWRNALDRGFATGLALAVILFVATLFVINTLAGPL